MPWDFLAKWWGIIGAVAVAASAAVAWAGYTPRDMIQFFQKKRREEIQKAEAAEAAKAAKALEVLRLAAEASILTVLLKADQLGCTSIELAERTGIRVEQMDEHLTRLVSDGRIYISSNESREVRYYHARTDNFRWQ